MIQCKRTLLYCNNGFRSCAINSGQRYKVAVPCEIAVIAVVMMVGYSATFRFGRNIGICGSMPGGPRYKINWKSANENKY